MKVSPSADVSAAVGQPGARPGAGGALPLAGLVVAAVGVAALANPDTIEDGPIICPFRLMTGLPCPGCGLTRSWVYLVHGQWQDSWSSNPFGLVLFAIAVGYVLMVGSALVRRRPLPDAGRFLRSRSMYVLGAVWVVFGAARLIAELAAR